MVDLEEYELRRGTAIWVRPGQVQRWNDDDFDAEVAVFESSRVRARPPQPSRSESWWRRA